MDHESFFRAADEVPTLGLTERLLLIREGKQILEYFRELEMALV